MTKTTFYCEKSDSQLIVLPQYEKLISLHIDNPEEEDKNSCIYLSIQDAENLMDNIHKAIIMSEGGKNE